jgi:hypothetical protein
MIRAGFDFLAGMAWNRPFALVVTDPILRFLSDSTALRVQPPAMSRDWHVASVRR